MAPDAGRTFACTTFAEACLDWLLCSRYAFGIDIPNKRPTEAWLDRRLVEGGFGYVVIARFKGSGDAEAGVFLVDRKCLEVKDAFLSRLSFADYQNRVLGRMFAEPEQGQPVSPACARKLVEGSIACARSLGLEPHLDYRLAQRVLGGINSDECTEEFTFGDNGKPLFIQSPNDSPEFVAHVMTQLQRRCGKDGFHYILEVGEQSF